MLSRIINLFFDGDIEFLEGMKFTTAAVALLFLPTGLYLLGEENTSGIWMILGGILAAACFVVYQKSAKEKADVKQKRKSLGYDD